MTLRQLWALPEYSYSVRVLPERPGIRANACLFDLPCGAGCGPVTRNSDNPATDGSGALRFRARDLPEMGSIMLVDVAGSERRLTATEMLDLLTTRQPVLDPAEQ